MKTPIKTWTTFALLMCAIHNAPPAARAQETEFTTTSHIAAIALPFKTERVITGQIPVEIVGSLKKVVDAAGAGVRQGKTEVLGWSSATWKKSKYNALKSQLANNLKGAGWTYEENADKEIAPMTLVSAFKSSPSRKALIGFWIPSDDALLLAWTEILPASTTPANTPSAPAKTSTSSTRSDNAPSAPTVFEVSGNTRNINVMKGVALPKPSFPKMSPKPGFVRGYVKNWKGQPLKGAVIGVRSTSAGGFYSGASAKSDARGYYEIKVPWGAASFYCAGYTVDWGEEGRAALGLGASDGEANQFASANGAIENWVLYPYGIADRDGVADDPQYSGNYFGGSFSVYTSITEDSDSTYALPQGSTYELTLTPVGTMFDGTKGRSFVIRRKLDSYNSTLYINNLPIGQYKLSAKLIFNGETKTLKIKETGPYSSQPNGLEPKEARGETTLMLRPYGAKANMMSANRGHWGSLDVSLYP